MKFNPLTNKVYTDRYQFIKKLHCPYKMQWNDMEGNKSSHRHCSMCENTVINTDQIEDQKLLSIVRKNPKCCLKIDLNQDNITIISKGSIKKS